MYSSVWVGYAVVTKNIASQWLTTTKISFLFALCDHGQLWLCALSSLTQDSGWWSSFYVGLCCLLRKKTKRRWWTLCWGLKLLSGSDTGEGNSIPLRYSCLENPMDRGAWRATVHGVSKSRIQLKDFTYGFCGPEISKKLGSKLCLDVSCEAEIRYRIDLHSSENLLGMEGPLLKWHTLLQHTTHTHTHTHTQVTQIFCFLPTGWDV